MAMSTTCPFCKTVNTLSQADQKVRCRKCGKPISTGSRKPSVTDQETDAIQQGSKVKLKTTANAGNKQDHPDQKLPRSSNAKNSKPVANKTNGMLFAMLAIGGVAGLLLCGIVVGGIAAFFMFRSKPAVADQKEPQVAQQTDKPKAAEKRQPPEAKNEEKKPPETKNEEKKTPEAKNEEKKTPEVKNEEKKAPPENVGKKNEMPEIKIGKEPEPKKEPKQVVNLPPAKLLPDQMTPDTVKRVKQATVYLRV